MQAGHINNSYSKRGLEAFWAFGWPRECCRRLPLARRYAVAVLVSGKHGAERGGIKHDINPALKLL